MLNLLPEALGETRTVASSTPSRGGDAADDAIGPGAPRDVELGAVTARPQAPATPHVPRRGRGLLPLPRLARGGASADEDAADDEERRLYATAEEVNSGIASIHGALQQLRAAHVADMQASRPEVVKSLRAQMRAEVAATSRTAARVKRQVEALAAEAARARAGSGAGSAAERVRSTLSRGLEVKFRDAMREFGDLRAMLQHDHAAVVARRYAAVVGHAPDEEELRSLAGDAPAELAESIFGRALAAAGRGAEPAAARAALAEVHERHDAIMELEKGLVALHQMFLDMAMLIDQQGDVIDSIESQVTKSAEYVERGKVSLAQARSHQRAARTKMIIVAVVAAVIVAVIACAIAIPTAVRG